MSDDMIKLIKRSNFNSSELIDLLASHDTLTKKITCDYLVDRSSLDSNLSLLTANILLRDCCDANPAVRKASLLALSNMSGMGEAAISSVSKAMNDSSPQVRRITPQCCVNIHRQLPEGCLSSGLIDSLYEGIRDSDPIAVTNFLLALETILRDEGGLIMNKNIAHYLVGRLPQFSDCNLVYILNLLKKYSPKREEETFQFLNELDPCLHSASPSVLLASVQLFIKLIQNFPNLMLDLYETVRIPFCKHLSQHRPELCFFVVEFVGNCSDEFKNTFSEEYKYFLVKTKDPYYLKEKKFEILPAVTNEKNLKNIVSEVKHYTTDFQNHKNAFKCLAALGSRFSEFEAIIEILIHALQTSNDQILEATLHCILSILLNRTEAEQEVTTLSQSVFPESFYTSIAQALTRSNVQDQNPKLIMYLLHFLVPFLENTQDILESLYKQYDSWDISHTCLFITCCCVCFLHWPSAVQPILSSVLAKALNASDKEIVHHAAFIYAALEEGPLEAFRLLSLSKHFPLLNQVDKYKLFV